MTTNTDFFLNNYAPNIDHLNTLINYTDVAHDAATIGRDNFDMVFRDIDKLFNNVIHILELYGQTVTKPKLFENVLTGPFADKLLSYIVDNKQGYFPSIFNFAGVPLDPLDGGPGFHSIIQGNLGYAFIDAAISKGEVNLYVEPGPDFVQPRIIETPASFIDPASRGGKNGADVSQTEPPIYPGPPDPNNIYFKNLNDIVNIDCYFYAKKYITHERIDDELNINIPLEPPFAPPPPPPPSLPLEPPFAPPPPPPPSLPLPPPPPLPALYNIIIIFKLDNNPLILNCLINRRGVIFAFTSFKNVVNTSLPLTFNGISDHLISTPAFTNDINRANYFKGNTDKGAILLAGTVTKEVKYLYILCKELGDTMQVVLLRDLIVDYDLGYKNSNSVLFTGDRWVIARSVLLNVPAIYTHTTEGHGTQILYNSPASPLEAQYTSIKNSIEQVITSNNLLLQNINSFYESLISSSLNPVIVFPLAGKSQQYEIEIRNHIYHITILLRSFIVIQSYVVFAQEILNDLLEKNFIKNVIEYLNPDYTNAVPAAAAAPAPDPAPAAAAAAAPAPAAAAAAAAADPAAAAPDAAAAAGPAAAAPPLPPPNKYNPLNNDFKTLVINLINSLRAKHLIKKISYSNYEINGFLTEIFMIPVGPASGEAGPSSALPTNYSDQILNFLNYLIHNKSPISQTTLPPNELGNTFINLLGFIILTNQIAVADVVAPFILSVQKELKEMSQGDLRKIYDLHKIYKDFTELKELTPSEHFLIERGLNFNNPDRANFFAYLDSFIKLAEKQYNKSQREQDPIQTLRGKRKQDHIKFGLKPAERRGTFNSKKPQEQRKRGTKKDKGKGGGSVSLKRNRIKPSHIKRAKSAVNKTSKIVIKFNTISVPYLYGSLYYWLNLFPASFTYLLSNENKLDYVIKKLVNDKSLKNLNWSEYNEFGKKIILSEDSKNISLDVSTNTKFIYSKIFKEFNKFGSKKKGEQEIINQLIKTIISPTKKSPKKSPTKTSPKKSPTKSNKTKKSQSQSQSQSNKTKKSTKKSQSQSKSNKTKKSPLKPSNKVSSKNTGQINREVSVGGKKEIQDK